jgi:hypothetical protein
MRSVLAFESVACDLLQGRRLAGVRCPHKLEDLRIPTLILTDSTTLERIPTGVGPPRRDQVYRVLRFAK